MFHKKVKFFRHANLLTANFMKNCSFFKKLLFSENHFRVFQKNHLRRSALFPNTTV